MPLVIAGISAAAALGGVITGYSVQRSATKKAKGQAEQAERIRTQEQKAMAATVERAEALPEKAKAQAAAIAAGRRRKRTTIATGPRGLLDEPMVSKPTLLGQ